jgi:hypothetical protein
LLYSKEIQTDIYQESIEPRIEPSLSMEPIQEPVLVENGPIVLTEEEKLSIIQSEPFAQFFDQSTKVIERVLNESYDVFTDYTSHQMAR